MATIIDKNSISETAPASLSLHLETTLNITADRARRRVNYEVVPELGTGLVAGEPELVVIGEQVRWRVPIELSLPGLGDLGQVGTVEVDAQSGHILTGSEEKDQIVEHADRLSHGATLQAE